MSFEVGFSVGLRAWCRDCGGKVPIEKLRGARGTQEKPSDVSGHLLEAVIDDACDACGGGRVAVKIDTGVSKSCD